ncbi:MAG TPA: hypothetical protein VFH70_00180 [Acidimicrobiales bacterium]|nr:hypothetical protein [Acidimicrobiales bacterium]
MTEVPDPGSAPRKYKRQRAAVIAVATVLVAGILAVIASGVLGGGTHHQATSGNVATSPDSPLIGPSSTAASTSATARAAAGKTSARSGTGAAPSQSPSGTSAPAAATTVNGCQGAAACVTLDATSPLGPENHAGTGFNALPSGYTDSSLLSSLDTQMYKGIPRVQSNGLFDWSEWDAAVAAGSKTTLILSDLWAVRYAGQQRPTPWSNWNTYNNWVKSTVGQIVASGRRVDYWDIYNEPGWRNEYSNSDFQSMTPQDLLQQFLNAYQDIRSVDPTAGIVGPSIGEMVFSPLPANDPVTHEPDMTTFLNFAANNNLKLAAVAWHQNGLTPQQIEADAARTWSMIRARPQLGHPAMFLDEYGAPWNQPIPGWDVGFLQAIEASGINYSVRSCWDGCHMSTLNGLLTSAQQTTAEYFNRVTYARMSGSRISVNSTDPAIAALGSISSSSQQVVAMIGRMVGCASPSWCNRYPSFGPAGVRPETVGVKIIVPWSTAGTKVSLTLDPFVPGSSLGAPQTVSPQNISLSPGGSGRELLTFDIPSFADGSAYNVVVTRN